MFRSLYFLLSSFLDYFLPFLCSEHIYWKLTTIQRKRVLFTCGVGDVSSMDIFFSIRQWVSENTKTISLLILNRIYLLVLYRHISRHVDSFYHEENSVMILMKGLNSLNSVVPTFFFRRSAKEIMQIGHL